jgi:hypothetical protein
MLTTLLLGHGTTEWGSLYGGFAVDVAVDLKGESGGEGKGLYIG